MIAQLGVISVLLLCDFYPTRVRVDSGELQTNPQKLILLWYHNAAIATFIHELILVNLCLGNVSGRISSLPCVDPSPIHFQVKQMGNGKTLDEVTFGSTQFR